MRTATQSEIRSWARTQGMHVNDRGSLPAAVAAAYAAAASTPEGTTPMATAATKRPGRKSAAPATGRKRTAVPKAPAAKASATPRAQQRRSRPAAKAATRRPAPAAAALPVDAPAAGSVDLAGGLRSYLDSVKVEVLAVSALSEQIDQLVAALNAAREEKATRLLVLDALRDAFSDGDQYGFLDKLIKPRKSRIPEAFPARLKGE